MPQFRFRVVTPDGRVKSGRFTGNSEAEARKQIEDSGLNILELFPIEESAPVVKLPRPPSWTSRINGYWVAAGLACIGLLWGGFSWRQRAHRAPVRQARGALEMADQRFEGDFKVQLPEGAPTGARLVVSFPEIPYQLSYSGKQAQEGVRVDFLAARTPGYCLLTLQDGKTVLAEARLEPVLASNEVQLHMR